MLKIEYKYSRTDKNTKIIVNDILDEDSFSFKIKDNDKMFAYFYDRRVIEIINNHSFKDVLSFFSSIGFNKDVDWWENGLEFEIDFDDVANNNNTKIRVNLSLDIEDWSRAWSIAEFSKEFQKSIKMSNNEEVQYYCEDGGENILNGFGIEYNIKNVNSIINHETRDVENILKNLVSITTNRLLAQINENSIITYFHFPTEIKQACCQYLIYFTQFIADIGIEVDSEIKENANQILFKVTPKNRGEALEFIKEALSIFLNSPSNYNFHSQIQNYENVAIKQWEANVYHLKSQLALANSILESKNATIEALQFSNYQYRQLITSQDKLKEEKEELIEGIISVKEYEGKGFSINFAEILRRLKRVIKE